MSDLTELAGRYIAVWNEPDQAKRAAAISELFTAEATYTDPLADVQGHEGIGAVIAGARDQFKGFDFRVLGDVDANHHIARFQWELVPASGGENIVIGFDVAVTDGAGKIRAVYGFLDKVPAGA
ncbi:MULTISPECIES: nuclear transport factor 2 family protein [Streptomyces]|uniref:nuclear transport factor 2 family protein n=1 Tax=Streptomyces TaxID=1883 RepID=UPI0013DC44A1|nr:nuclear transport factor 2 family protein [Streptomyces aureoverticillatus]QIB41720.1 nuclear transport factor 2 family protein [Streptomyces aureoverticillatus]QIB48418.1 nuclear transport factor 2 family protein [Streptomyces aureoverticillatus]